MKELNPEADTGNGWEDKNWVPIWWGIVGKGSAVRNSARPKVTRPGIRLTGTPLLSQLSLSFWAYSQDWHVPVAGGEGNWDPTKMEPSSKPHGSRDLPLGVCTGELLLRNKQNTMKWQHIPEKKKQHVHILVCDVHKDIETGATRQPKKCEMTLIVY